MLEKPLLLLVLQQDQSLLAAKAEKCIIQSANMQVESLISVRATPTMVLEHLQDYWFVYIICHMILKQGKLFNSLFKLYKGD